MLGVIDVVYPENMVCYINQKLLIFGFILNIRSRFYTVNLRNLTCFLKIGFLVESWFSKIMSIG